MRHHDVLILSGLDFVFSVDYGYRMLNPVLVNLATPPRSRAQNGGRRSPDVSHLNELDFTSIHGLSMM
nr:hypothetical protein CFP56_67396 [Quercus suber]